MDQALYFRLIVIALCSSSECSQPRYHYINMKKTWTEAQIYCRTLNYTDLATVNNINDMKQLKNTVKNNKNVWIGLKNTGVNKWKWSLGDHGNYSIWESGPSSDTNNCAFMRNGTWRQQNCNVRSQFICYNESNKFTFTFSHLADAFIQSDLQCTYYRDNPPGATWSKVSCSRTHWWWLLGLNQQPFDLPVQWCNQWCNPLDHHLHNKRHIIYTSSTTWREAQSFCRKHHTDLTSVRNQTDNQLIHNIINDPHTSVWIGLFRDSWEWSDNTESGFRYWRSGEPNGGTSPAGFCTEIMNVQGQWNDAGCSKPKPFVCHEVIHQDSNSSMSETTPADNGTLENVNEADDKLILIEENLSWTEAVRYCRTNHEDLVLVDSEKIQLWVKAVVHQASTSEVWLGLRLSCSVGIWFWVNGEIACYQNWAPGNETEVDDCESEGRSGAVQSGGGHLWISLPESKQLNFICSRYD